jgi:hypothetical protein
MALVKGKDAKKNIKTLVNIGIDLKDLIITGSDVSYQIVEKIKLSDVSETEGKFKCWIKEAEEYATRFI